MNTLSRIWSKPEGKVFTVAGIIYVLLVLFANGVNGGADTFTHYQMSRYSWIHHDLLLNQWGKPVFTVLFSPIAQLGLQAIILTNLALIFFEAFLVLKIANQLDLKRSWLAPLLFLTCPVVFDNAVSSLTEIICALFLILFIHWSLRGKFFLGALVLSFMPFARSEGFVILGVAAMFFFFTRRWKFIPLLAVGSIILNLFGYWYTGIPLWIFDSNPYVNTEITSYGSGSFFHFFIWAIPVFGIGFLFLLKSTWLNAHTIVNRLTIDWKSATGSEDSRNFILKHQVMFWIVLGSFWGYFMAHTVLWWQGMWASLGLLRVMFVVAVPMVLLALIELNKFLDSRPLIGSWKTVNVIIVLLCGTAFGTNTLILGAVGAPVEYGIEESVLNEMKGWMKAEGITTQGCVFAGHSYVSLALDRDPFDYTKMNQLRSFKYAQKGDLIVWDGHYGPNEENTPIEMLERDTTLIFLKEFRPEREYRPLNDMPFYVRLYRKK
ncbi:MAG: hypothetical protein ACOVMJ_02655 [Flavobacteriales bacterium]|jgi:hypothetical protein